MSGLERISFLQEKLQDIRNHYLSLKSEVASIDRRRKRMKKKERESESTLCDLDITGLVLLQLFLNLFSSLRVKIWIPIKAESASKPTITKTLLSLSPQRHGGRFLLVLLVLVPVLQLTDCGGHADAGRPAGVLLLLLLSELWGISGVQVTGPTGEKSHRTKHLTSTPGALPPPPPHPTRRTSQPTYCNYWDPKPTTPETNKNNNKKETSTVFY